MSPEVQPTPDPNEEELRLQLINAMEQAVENEDYLFVNEIANSQSILHPVEIVEYFNVRRKNSEESAEEDRWTNALDSYRQTLGEWDFTDDEQQSLNSVFDEIEFESITKNDETAEEAQIEEDIDPDFNWDNDFYGVALSEEEIEDIRSLRVFQEAEKEVDGSSVYGVRLYKAKEKVEKYFSGDDKTKALKVLDWFVYKEAEKEADGSSVYGVRLRKAKKIVEEKASDEEEKHKMKAALDKYVFQEAEKEADGSSVYGVRLRKAKEIVEKYSSSPERMRAMLHKLGFML